MKSNHTIYSLSITVYVLRIRYCSLSIPYLLKRQIIISKDDSTFPFTLERHLTNSIYIFLNKANKKRSTQKVKYRFLI